MVVDTTKSCKPSILCDIPLVRGDCVIIPLMRGDCGGCVGIPLSVEVIFGVLAKCLIPQVCGDYYLALSLIPLVRG